MINTIPEETIKAFQFSTLSPEDKKKLAFVNIKNFSGLEGGVPKPGSLYDLRMGTVLRETVCATCRLQVGRCPGHFGILQLATPIFNIIYIDVIKKILHCKCFKCGRLLIKKKDREKLRKMNPKLRLQQCKKYADPKRIKVCNYCNFPNNIKYQKDKAFNLRYRKVGQSSTKYKNVNTVHTLQHFIKFTNEDIRILGLSPKFSRPEWFIMETILVPSQNIRPTVFTNESSNQTEDNLFKHLKNIIKANNELKSKKKINAPEQEIDRHYLNLALTIASFYTDKVSKKNEGGFRSMGSNKPLNSIKDMYTGKTAIIRGNLMGKRVDLSSRTVISSDSNLAIDEIGVPQKIAMDLSIAVIVNKYNITEIKKYMANGPKKWPGAKYIIKAKTKGKKLLIHDEHKMKTIIDNVEYGDIVYRHLIDGDSVIFNRQPSLHKLSIMGFHVKIIPNKNSFRLNNCVTVPFNADFDGDEMNMFVFHSYAAKAEIDEIMDVKQHIVNPVDSKTIISMIQDNALGAYFITKNGDEIWPRYKFMQLINHISYINLSKLQKGKKSFKLIEAVELILPDNFTYRQKPFDIQNGKWHKGILNKSTVKKLIKVLFHNYGHIFTAKFISSLQRLTDAYLSMRGYSIGINDCFVKKEIKDKVEQLVNKAQIENLKVINEFDQGAIVIPITKTPLETFESIVRNKIINKCEREALEILKTHLANYRNNFPDMIKAKSKGKDENLQQILNFVGQQIVDGERIKMSYGDRTSPHSQKYSQGLIDRGFVPFSYSEGLTSRDFFSLAAGARTGLIDTALRTAEIGYLARKLARLLESIVIEYDSTVRMSGKKIVSYSFGGYHYDTTYLVENDLPLYEKSYEQILEENI
jgi:DNA-directed RNA polymerase beta' subunit